MNVISRIIARISIFQRNRNILADIRKCGGRLDSNSKLYFGGNFSFGKNLIVNNEGIDNTTRSQIYVLPGATLEIGDNVGMSQVSITCKDHITIGNNVVVGAGTMIFDTDFHSSDWKLRRQHEVDLLNAKNAPVRIGDDCFIGARTIICKGVSIGSRSLIAAGSVVAKDIPADCIAGGNPCRVINKNDC